MELRGPRMIRHRPRVPSAGVKIVAYLRLFGDFTGSARVVNPRFAAIWAVENRLARWHRGGNYGNKAENVVIVSISLASMAE